MAKYIDFSEVFTKNYCEYSKYVIGYYIIVKNINLIYNNIDKETRF